MKYEIKYDPKAERQLDKLPKDIARRVVKKMREIGDGWKGSRIYQGEGIWIQNKGRRL